MSEEEVCLIDSMKLTKHDYEMIADILDAHYEETVELQKNHYLKNLHIGSAMRLWFLHYLMDIFNIHYSPNTHTLNIVWDSNI